MSWSINLAGKYRDVVAELEAAKNVIDDALDTLSDLPNETVTVSCNGYASSSDNGYCSYSASFTVGGDAPPPVEVPVAAQEVPEVAEAAPVAEEVPATPTTIVP